MQLPSQPFPFFPLHCERINVPDGIILGQETKTGKNAVIHKSDLKSHFYILGKTGSGKTMLLLLFIANLLSMGRRVIFIDPLGSLYSALENWQAYMSRKYYQKEGNSWKWFLEEFQQKTLFMDLSKGDHPFRSNMIQGFNGESLSGTIDRLVLFFDALFSSMDIELQRRQGLVTMTIIFTATQNSMECARDFIYNKDGFQDRLLQQADSRSNIREVRRAIGYWSWVRETYRGSSYGDKVFSLLTGLSQFEENLSVFNFLFSQECNIDWKDIFANKSLFIKLPNASKAVKVLMNYLYSGIFYPLISRRKVDEDTDILHIGSDESGVIINEEYSTNITQSRNKRCFFISAYQTRNQLLEDKLMRAASTVEDQSKICIYFHVGNEDAEKIVKEQLSPNGKRLKHIEKTTTITKNVSEAYSKGFSKALSFIKSLMHGQSVQETFSQSSTEILGVTENISLSETLNQQFSLAHAEGNTRSWSDGNTFNVTWTDGNTIGRTTTDGFTFTMTDQASVAEVTTESGTVTITGQESESSSDSTSTSQSRSKTENKPKYTVSFQGNPANATIGSSVSAAFQNAKSISKSFAQSESHAKGHSEAVNVGCSKSQALAMSKQLGESVSVLKNFAEGVAQSYQQSTGFNTNITSTKGLGETLGLTRGIAANKGKNIGDSVAQSKGEQTNQGVNKGSTVTENENLSKSVGESVSVSYRNVYYSVEEEARILTHEIRDLLPRQFLFCVKGKKPVIVTTATCFSFSCWYGNYNFLQVVRDYQRCLLQGEEFTMLPSSVPKTDDEDDGEIYKSLDFENFLSSD